ncbi:response regulator [Salegentibacter mishustinae]|uniref:hybrid sensor histidine kinase/response regulator n=1 Tax=Salegentibacter mishustinae TaxID=270918 RepID=UPI001CE2092F|nr:ATP-binding protein [Salegentibacter mishustinae]UBZ07835.1 response regulator [Salegentibacter mishustinae]
MRNTKRSITYKVIGGYLLIAALAAVSVWLVWNQVVAFSRVSENNNNNNEQLFMLSDITTSLYETENLSRQLIQTGNETDLEKYQNQIDSIQLDIQRLKTGYADSSMKSELDSIKELLSEKSTNLQELYELREQQRNQNYYSQVLNELKKIDPSFEDYNYRQRFSNLEPHQRRLLIRWLEYSREDNAEKLTNRTADSIIGSVRNVLSELEIANRRFQNTVDKKEQEFLENDMIINQQLRRLLGKIELEEREASIQRAKVSQNMIEESSQIFLIAGIVSFLIILLSLIFIIKDITKSQQYRRELEEAKDFAETLLKRREQFMAAITHDLRSPLNTLIGYTDLIEKSSLNTKQSHYMDQVKKSSNFILHLVNDLLDLSKLEAGKMTVEKLPFNPAKLIKDTVYNALPATRNENVAIVFEASKDADTQVLSDPFRIKQIIANLITNACKFTKEGEIKVNIYLKKEIEDSYCLIISVKDTGIGISEEKQEEIFEEFSQENTKIEKAYGGTGLGLTITKSLTELLKGELKLKSKQGEGSEFTVFLPVRKLTTEAAKVPEVEATPELPDLSGKTALIVDDEPSQLSLTGELLKSMGMQCDSALNGSDALKKLENREYSLVLTDIQMPEMDGFDLIKNIRKKYKIGELPVIALSGRTDVDAETYKLAGFNKSLLKPYKPGKLQQSIAAIFKLELKEKVNNNLQHSKNNHYDLQDIYDFSAGDQEAVQTILEAFIESSRSQIELIAIARKNNDEKEVSRLAHKMVPMLKQINAKHLARQLERLEQNEAFTDKEFNQLKAGILNLMEELEQEVKV